MSCISERYMEYSIMTTNRCNLRCAYCINGDRRRRGPDMKADGKAIVRHILKDSSENGYSPVVITFYGGEPLMELELLAEVMEGTAALEPMFILFTNGTLMSPSNLGLLNRMFMISLSIDGDREMHDAVRGKGSFDRVMGNYRSIRSLLKPEVVAFVTLTPRSSVYRSVTGLEGEFGNVFWFLENSPAKENLKEFVARYDRDLDALLEQWLNGLRAGKVLKYIPFQGLYDILEKKHEYTGLPCGIGSNYQAIAIDGSLYSCEDSYHNRIGDLSSGVDAEKVKEFHVFPLCAPCEVKSVCAGRCVIPHFNYDAGKVNFYCECSKLIIGKFMRVLPAIRQLIASGTLDEKALLNRLTRFTDVIP